MVEDVKLVPAPDDHKGPVLFNENMKHYCIKILVNGEWVDVRVEEDGQ